MSKHYEFTFSFLYWGILHPFRYRTNLNQDDFVNELFAMKPSVSGTIISDILHGKRMPDTLIKKTAKNPEQAGYAEYLRKCFNENNFSIEDYEYFCNRLKALVYMLNNGTLVTDSITNNQIRDIVQADSLYFFNKVEKLIYISLKKNREELDKHAAGEVNNLFTEALQEYKSFSLLNRYNGLYHIYYYSSHYIDTLHTGLLSIYETKERGHRARMIFGLNSSDKLIDEPLKEIMNPKISDEDAFEIFKTYRSKYEHRFNKRFYLYCGNVSSNNAYLDIDFLGTGRIWDHRMTLYLNVVRVASYDYEKASYLGGLGLCVSSPNNATSKIRCFRMGVIKEDIEVKTDDPWLKDLLKLSPTEMQRVQVQKDDDTAFFDFIIHEKAKMSGDIYETKAEMAIQP